MAVPLVSRITEALGLPGNAPDAVDAARDKHSTRAKMQAAGLPTPRNVLIQKPADIQEAADKVRFPAGNLPHVIVMFVIFCFCDAVCTPRASQDAGGWSAYALS